MTNKSKPWFHEDIKQFGLFKRMLITIFGKEIISEDELRLDNWAVVKTKFVYRYLFGRLYMISEDFKCERILKHDKEQT